MKIDRLQMEVISHLWFVLNFNCHVLCEYNKIGPCWANEHALWIVKFGICTYELSTDTSSNATQFIYKIVRLCECLYVRKVIENREILSACMRVNERRWRRSSNHVQTGVTHVKHIPNGIAVLVYWCNRTTIKNTHFYTQTVLAHTHHIWHGLWFYFLIFLAFSFLGLPSFKLTYMMWYDVRTCLCLL